MARLSHTLVGAFSPVPRASLSRTVVSSLARAAALLAASAIVLPFSLAGAAVVLTFGSVIFVAWSFRGPWPLTWLSGSFPAMGALFTLLAAAVIPVSGAGGYAVGGIAGGGILGLVAGLRHRLDRKHGRTLAWPAWGPVLVWGLGLVALQVGALSGEMETARIGMAAAGFGSALVVVLFLVLLVRRATRRAGPALLGLLLLMTPRVAPAQESHDVELSRVLAGEVRGLTVRLSGGEGYASGRLLAYFTNETGRTVLVGVMGGSVFFPRNSSDAPTMVSSSDHVLEVTAGAVARQINAAPVPGYQPAGECAPGSARAPSGGNVRVGVACPFPGHVYGMEPGAAAAAGPAPIPEPGPGADPDPDPDGYVDPLPEPPPGYVPRYLLVEGGEEAGVFMGAIALLTSLLSSLGLALAQGAGSTVAPVEIRPPSREELLSPPSGAHVPPWEDPVVEELADLLRQRRAEWLASSGQLPETLTGEAPLSPWGGEGYRIWRQQREHVDRALQELRSPGDVFDPTHLKQEEMDDYTRFEAMRQANREVRFVRAVTAGGGDVASDPDPGLLTALTGGLHAIWDAVGPDPTSIPEGMVDPQSEYRDLLEAWRDSQSWSRWLRIGTPRTPSDIRKLIESLKDERHAEQMEHLGDDEYFTNEYPKWDEELRRLRALEEWLGRAGGAP